jgi:hypothetical protein
VTGETIRRHAGVAGDRGGLLPHGTLSLRQASHVTKWHRFATPGHTDWDDLFAGYAALW